MGVELYITRAEFWADNDAALIPADEWLRYVDRDPELTLAPANGEYFALWSGESKDEEPWLDWFQGNIHTKWPDTLLYRKMLEIARDLGAHVQDDDGNTYTSPAEWDFDSGS